jgi:transglutaminase-like putative cysteine protease
MNTINQPTTLRASRFLRWLKPERPSPADVATHLTLFLACAVSVAATLRLFTDRSFLHLVIGSTVIGIAVPLVVRMLRLPWLIGLLTSGALEVWLCLRWFKPKRTDLSLNGIRDAVAVIRTAVAQVNTLVVPVPPLVGFGLLLGFAAWLVATLGDLFLGSFRGRYEALLPPATGVIIATVLLARTKQENRTGWLIAVLAAMALHVITVAAIERASVPNWFSASSRSIGTAMTLAIVLFGAAGATAHVVTERLSLGEKSPAIDWRVDQNVQSQGPRTITSPLVSLRRRLIQQSSLEQFRARALDENGNPTPSYWRLSALDLFDGSVFEASGNFKNINGGSDLGPSKANGVRLKQEIEIRALDTEMVPFAYRPVRVKSLESAQLSSAPTIASNTPNSSIDTPVVAPAKLQFDAQTSVILADKELQPGQRFEAVSIINVQPPPEVTSGTPVLSADPAVSLPDTISPRIYDLAREITADETTTIGKARAIQDFFRSGFAYTLDPPAVAASNPLESFLFEDRAGYCQQFSAGFAVLARAVNIPSRVAVGFTAGTVDNDGWYSVTGKNAHAWPEIRLSDGSWVAFEPTPGRSVPGGEGITGVPFTPAQDDPTATTVAPGATTTVTTSASNSPRPTIAPNRQPNPPQKSTSHLQLLVGVLLGVGALAAAIAVRRRRDKSVVINGRTRRLLVNGSPIEQIDLLWTRFEHTLSRYGRKRRVNETERQYAEQFADKVPSAIALADLAQRARYDNPNLVNDEDASHARRIVEDLEHSLVSAGNQGVPRD